MITREMFIGKTFTSYQNFVKIDSQLFDRSDRLRGAVHTDRQDSGANILT